MTDKIKLLRLKIYWRIDPIRIKTKLGYKIYCKIVDPCDKAMDLWFDLYNQNYDYTLQCSDYDLINLM